ncbi:hypothetical protein [Persephonella sp.]|uniref:hypothetical protein n=1 Tax=Persephonella sp. TaxID=2060922 RepID=UPI002633A4B2|nr:hypothetical protein [Persephonella sp.]
MKYAVFDKKGFPRAFYDDEIHETIPQNAVKITEQQWLEFINNQGKRKWNFNKNDVVVYEPPPPTPEELKAKIQGQLTQLEEDRLKLILKKSGYNEVDILFYANQGDSEAKGILDWYSTYDTLIWNWIDQILPVIKDLQSVDVKAVEEDLFNQSVKTNPLP